MRHINIIISGVVGSGKTATALWIADALKSLNPNVDIEIEDDDIADASVPAELIEHSLLETVSGLDTVTIRTIRLASNDRPGSGAAIPGRKHKFSSLGATRKAAPEQRTPEQRTLDAARARFTSR